ncbi:hypothetical protein IAD21_06285 [Abditibacteriota bacterium]|nr:hypothetical protein IAD21_06285 [Abditibacteriota bacterium]
MTPNPMAPGGCWPTPTQELLLRAALLEGKDAVTSWREWQARTDIEHLDYSSSSLLPLLLRNLEKQGVQDSHLGRYKSVSRHHWMQNQLLFEAAKHLIQLLENEGIPTLVLKGGALIPLYYPKVSMRPMGNFEVLVPTSEAARAFKFLLTRGYRLKGWNGSSSPPDRAFSVFHSYPFYQQKEGSTDIRYFDVHQHVFSQTFAPNADDEFWNAAVPLQIEGVSAKALCPEDMLLHVCAHGIHWDAAPPLRWIADATLILRSQPDFDWARLIAQTRRHHVSLPTGQALKYLQRLGLGLSIPGNTLREIESIPTSRSQRREWSALTHPTPSHPIALKFWRRLLTYSRWNRINPAWQRPFTFPRYMQFCWGLDSIFQVPLHGLKRFYSMTISKSNKNSFD